RLRIDRGLRGELSLFTGSPSAPAAAVASEDEHAPGPLAPKPVTPPAAPVSLRGPRPPGPTRWTGRPPARCPADPQDLVQPRDRQRISVAHGQVRRGGRLRAWQPQWSESNESPRSAAISVAASTVSANAKGCPSAP